MVGLPVAAVLLRFSAGSRQIRCNWCGVIFRRLQFCALGMAVFIFMFADFLIVLSAFIPKERRRPPPEDIPIYVVALTLYVTLVVIAMFPGRRNNLIDAAWTQSVDLTIGSNAKKYDDHPLP